MKLIFNPQETHIDSFLIQAFYEENEQEAKFVSWFLKQLEIEGAVPCHLEKSKNFTGPKDINGEVDIYLEFKKTDGSTCEVQIENKISACFQEDQAERYKKRIALVNNNPRTDKRSSKSVLIAPKNYLSNAEIKSVNCFAYKLSYEDIMDQISSKFTKQILQNAIEKVRNFANSDEVTEFWKKYKELVDAQYTDLKMKYDDGKKRAGSLSIYFYPWGSKDIYIGHQTNAGQVILYINSNHDKYIQMENLFSASEYKDNMIKTQNETIKVVFETPQIDMKQSFDNSKVNEALEKANQIFNFCCSHPIT